SEGPGRGSEFVIAIPAIPAGESEDAVSEAPCGGRLFENVPRHRVLVVDDAQSSAETLALILKAMGQEASTAYDGQTAVEWTLENRPDLVFLDIAMPGMDGYEAAGRIRAALGRDGPLLVALTGYGQE